MTVHVKLSKSAYREAVEAAATRAANHSLQQQIRSQVPNNWSVEVADSGVTLSVTLFPEIQLKGWEFEWVD